MRTISRNDCSVIPFQPPILMIILTNNFDAYWSLHLSWVGNGDRWERSPSSYLQERIDILTANGWGLHTELVPNGNYLTKEQRATKRRVHRWTTMINTMCSVQGFSARIEQLEEVCSYNKILRKSGKACQFGACILVVELSYPRFRTGISPVWLLWFDPKKLF